MKDIIKLENSWLNELEDEFAKPYMKELKFLLEEINKDKQILPKSSLWFNALNYTPLPKSLLNINKELLSDLEIDNSNTGYLQPWAEQGILLLNAVLTVEASKSNSHQGKGWEKFTDKIIEIINKKCNNIVFILWGAYAQKKGISIDINKHLIIKSPHPSPLSAYRGFFGSKPFSKTNSYLLEHNKKIINWGLKNE